MELEIIIQEAYGRYYVINCYILGITFKEDVAQLKIKDEWGEVKELPLENIYYHINQIKNRRK